MARRTPAQVYASLIAAGASDGAARILTEIAGAESGYDDSAQGDTSLESNTWGPSYGLFQIRTLKAQTGSGSDRDISNLAGDDQAQAAAALEISGGGQNFQPWTTFRTGAYQQFAGGVSAAVPSPGGAGTSPAGAATPASDTPNPTPFPTFGPSWLPWNWPSDAGNAAAGAAGDVFGSIRTVVLEAAFAVLGLALVGIGIKRLSDPVTAGVRDRAEDAAKVAAVAA